MSVRAPRGKARPSPRVQDGALALDSAGQLARSDHVVDGEALLQGDDASATAPTAVASNNALEVGSLVRSDHQECVGVGGDLGRKRRRRGVVAWAGGAGAGRNRRSESSAI
eukprot:scaffold22309_cov116-Isochrysis_galbana.AAC.2